MELSSVSEWFRTTIAGIVFLGAFGSIVAYYIIKTFRWILNKYLTDIFRNYAFKFFKKILMHLALAQKYSGMTSTNLLVIQLIYLGFTFIFTSILLSLIVMIMALYIAFKGITITFTTISLIIIFFLCLFSFVKASLSFYAACIPSIYKDIEKTKDIFREIKDEEKIIEFIKSDIEDRKS